MAEALLNNNYPANPIEEAYKQSQVSKLPFGSDHGFEVSVPTADQVEQSIPPAEHWPFAWIDIYTGASLRRRSFALMGYNLGGLAQLAFTADEPLNPNDIKRVEDIASIRIRQTTANGTPSSCEIVLQNALELIPDKSNNLVWSRVDFKPGRFADGQIIRYMSTTPVNGNYWYRGTLKEVKLSTDPHMVELENRFFNVVWADKAPPEAYDGLSLFLEAATTVNILPAGRFYAEDAGEPIFEPMQKIKIYGVNRYQPEILTQFGYRTISAMGATTDTSNENTMIQDGGESGTPHITDSNGKSVSPTDSMQYSGTPAFQYASPIFTGYISDVTNQQRGANWEIRIQARDVTIWMDYSLLNINQSINAFGVEPSGGLGPFQLYTNRFESMPAHEIVRALFLGVEQTITKVATQIYFDREMTKPITTTVYDPLTGRNNVENVVIPANKPVYIHDRWPPIEDIPTDYQRIKSNILTIPETPYTAIVAYKVGTEIGIEGWIPVWVDASGAPVTDPLKQSNKTEAVTTPQRSYPGLGFFVEDNNKKYPLVAVGSPKQQTILPYDKLNIFNAVEPYNEDSEMDEDSKNDGYVVRAYERYFRQNWPLIQSDFVTRRSILNEVCKASNCECYADGDGKVWFHPVWAYHSVKNLAYIIQQEECLSWAFTFSDREIVTWSQVTGEFRFDVPPGVWTYGLALESPEMVETYGVRALNMQNPNVKSSTAAVTYARSVMARINSNKITGSVTVIMRPELQLANNVYIPWLNMIGYISSIDHVMQWGQQAVTTIGLKYVRHPWDRWTPIEYLGGQESTDPWGFGIGLPLGESYWANDKVTPIQTSSGSTNETIPNNTSTPKVQTDVGDTVGVKTPTGEMNKNADKSITTAQKAVAPIDTRTRKNSAMDNDAIKANAPKDIYTPVGTSQEAVDARTRALAGLKQQGIKCALYKGRLAGSVTLRANMFAVLDSDKFGKNEGPIAQAFRHQGFSFEGNLGSREQAIYVFRYKQ